MNSLTKEVFNKKKFMQFGFPSFTSRKLLILEFYFFLSIYYFGNTNLNIFEYMIDVEAQKVSIIISNMLIIYNYSGCQLKKMSISKVIYYINFSCQCDTWCCKSKGIARSFYQALTSYFWRVMSYKKSFFISIDLIKENGFKKRFLNLFLRSPMANLYNSD